MRKQATIACALCDHHRTALAVGLDPQQVASFENDKTTQLLRVGQTLFCEGGVGHSVHCVRSGLFKLFKLGIGGESLVLRLAGPGTVLGLRSALAEEPYEATAEAIEDSIACSVPRQSFEACLRHSPEMARCFLRRLAIEIRENQERLLEVLHCNVMQRAAHLLLEMNEQLDSASLLPVAARTHIKRMDLASMIGTTPESMSRALHQLAQRRIVNVSRDRIEVLDVAKLRLIARMPADGEIT